MLLAEPNAPEPLPLSRRHTLVLVDDELEVLRSLRRLLRKEPYDLLCTITPELALGWIENHDVCLLLVDQRMPGMCGTDLAERVRRCSPRTLRVMLTAFPGNSVVQHGLAQDVQWLISKPWSDDALRLTLRQLLHERESPPPPSDPAQRPRSTRRSRSSPGASDPQGSSWPPGRIVRRVLGAAARGFGWGLGFFWTTDAGGVFPR
jgi:response regulator RpfG family c-di-GMP phosphodiesterase